MQESVEQDLLGDYELWEMCAEKKYIPTLNWSDIKEELLKLGSNPFR